MGNATAMLEELEKSASSGQAPLDEATVKAIMQLLNDVILVGLKDEQSHRQKGPLDTATSIYEGFEACNVEAKMDLSEAQWLDIDPAGGETTAVGKHNECRTDHKGQKEHNDALHAADGACTQLDSLLSAATNWVDSNAYSDAVTSQQKVKWVNDATGAKLCAKDEATDLYGTCITARDLTLEYEIGENEAEWKCNALQTHLEDKFCQWRAQVKQDCDAAHKCYTDLSAAIEAHKAVSVDLTEGWKKESLALKKIECYLKAFDSTDTTDKRQEKLATCESATDHCGEGDFVFAVVGDATSAITTEVNPLQCKVATDIGKDRNWGITYDDGLKAPYTKCKDRVTPDKWQKATARYPGLPDFVADYYTPHTAGWHGLAAVTACIVADGPGADMIGEAATKLIETNSTKRLVRREPKKVKASSLAELDSQGRVEHLKVEAAAESSTEKSNLRDMDVDSLMNLVISSGASTTEIKAAMTKAILKLQGPSV